MSIVAAFAVPHPPLIIPGVSDDKRAQIASTVAAYEEVGRRIARLRPETVVISSPHADMYLDYLHISPGAGATGSFARFGAPQASYHVDYDEQFVHALCREAREVGISAGTAGEKNPELDHGTMIPWHFIQAAWKEVNAASAGPDAVCAGADEAQAERDSARADATPVPLPRVVRMGISGLSPLDHYRLGQAVQHVAALLGRRVVYVASGDLSHKLLEEGPYGFAKEGPEFDDVACEALGTSNFLDLLTMEPGFCERAAECGLRSFQIMAGALDRTPVKAELLSHEGPFGVGYGVAAFEPLGEAGSAPDRNFGEQYLRFHAADMRERRENEDAWVELARRALEAYVRDGAAHAAGEQSDGAATGAVTGAAGVPDASALLGEMNRAGRLSDDVRRELEGTRAGCFVSLKKNGQLRGCIGTTGPTRVTLAEEICGNAVAAGTRDPRFSAVEADELDELVYDVDVLGVPEDVDSTVDLDCRRYGVIVSTPDGRRGLLLPDLDGVDTVDEQVRIAARKGGIYLGSDDVRLQRFSVTRHL